MRIFLKVSFPTSKKNMEKQNNKVLGTSLDHAASYYTRDVNNSTYCCYARRVTSSRAMPWPLNWRNTYTYRSKTKATPKPPRTDHHMYLHTCDSITWEPKKSRENYNTPNNFVFVGLKQKKIFLLPCAKDLGTHTLPPPWRTTRVSIQVCAGLTYYVRWPSVSL